MSGVALKNEMLTVNVIIRELTSLVFETFEGGLKVLLHKHIIRQKRNRMFDLLHTSKTIFY